MAEEPRVRLYYSLSAFNPKHHHAIINQRASKEEKEREITFQQLLKKRNLEMSC